MDKFLDIKAKKSLGQNFLKSKKALLAMINAGEVGENDIVLEAGPGKGALTEELLKKAGKVIAVEKDDALVEFLPHKFSSEIASGKLQLIHNDILEFDPSSYNLKPKTYKLIANIPYYITGALFRKFLTAPHQPSTLVFLIQKEVAERIARSAKESILSLSVKAYGVPKYIKTVPAGAFSPPPKVDSAILAVENLSRKNFKNAAHEEKFFMLVKKGFAQKRKFLSSNLGPSHSNILQNVGVNPKARAEDVPLGAWLEISR